MTYALLIAPFATVTALVALSTVRRPAFGRRMRASALAALALIVLTAVFDNVMIAAGLFTYPPTHVSGVRVGLAPIEDFAYPVCAAFFVPAVFALAQRRGRA